MISKDRVFGKKKYHLKEVINRGDGGFHTARSAAEAYREEGWLIRVIEGYHPDVGKEWYLYGRRVRGPYIGRK